MAGVFTDNQPDSAFLKPGETKTFSQYWYPIQETGPVHQATRDAAVRLDVTTADGRTTIRAAVATTAARSGARVLVRTATRAILDVRVDVEPGRPYVEELVVDATI